MSEKAHSERNSFGSLGPLKSPLSPSQNSCSTSRGSFDEFRKRTRLEADFPVFRRSNSTKRYHVPSSLSDAIREEIDEADVFSPFTFRRVFSPYSLMPKEEFLIFDSKPKQEPIIQNLSSNMDIIPEIDDENNNNTV